jgi:hypothetical protein
VHKQFGRWGGLEGERLNDARSDLTAFIADHSGEKILPPSGADLLETLGIDGDDAFELMDDFGRRFEVDMSKYLWYFHHGEEGVNIGGIVFRPPYRRVSRIPLSTDLMLEAMQTKEWPVLYPAHRLPTVRWDMWLNILLFAAIPLGLAALWLWSHFVR